MKLSLTNCGYYQVLGYIAGQVDRIASSDQASEMFRDNSDLFKWWRNNIPKQEELAKYLLLSLIEDYPDNPLMESLEWTEIVEILDYFADTNGNGRE